MNVETKNIMNVKRRKYNESRDENIMNVVRNRMCATNYYEQRQSKIKTQLIIILCAENKCIKWHGGVDFSLAH